MQVLLYLQSLPYRNEAINLDAIHVSCPTIVASVVSCRYSASEKVLGAVVIPRAQ
jgi:hypothetical protein